MEKAKNYLPYFMIAFLILFFVSIRVFNQYSGIPSADKQYFQDENGFPYLQDPDSYIYYHKADIGQLDDGMSWTAFYWHKFLKLFQPDITLMGAMSFLPLLFGGLTILNIFFITYYFARDYFVSFMAGMILSVNSQFFKASFIGNGDTQLAVFFFSTLIIFLIIELLERIKSIEEARKNPTILFSYFVLIAFFLAVFSWFWSGWYYLLFIISAAFFVYLSINLFKDITIKRFMIIFFLIIIIIGISAWKWPFKGYISSEIKEQIGLSEITEMQEYGPETIFYIDNILIIIAVLIFWLYYCWSNKDFKSIFILIWFLLLFYAAMKSFRFIHLAILPYSIMAGICFSWMLDMTWKKWAMKGLIMFLLLSCVYISLKSYSNDYFVDDGISSLKYVNLPENAGIVNHWQSGYTIRALTGKEIRFEGTPSVNNIFITVLLSQNESDAYNSLKSLVLPGQIPIIVLTNKDVGAIDFWYKIEPNSLLIKLLYNKSDRFRMIYGIRTPYNWIMVWGER